MNLAKQLEENDDAVSDLDAGEQTDTSNIISLPDHGFSRRKLEPITIDDEFARHRFSALNEW